MKIEYNSDINFIGTSPAGIDRSNPKNPILYINPNVFNKLTPFQQKFVVEHENDYLKKEEFLIDIPFLAVPAIAIVIFIFLFLYKKNK